MTLAESAVRPRELNYAETSKGAPASGGLWRRLFAAMVASRHRHAEREVALYLQSVGGKFTDYTEREIERRSMPPRSQW